MPPSVVVCEEVEGSKQMVVSERQNTVLLFFKLSFFLPETHLKN